MKSPNQRQTRKMARRGAAVLALAAPVFVILSMLTAIPGSATPAIGVISWGENQDGQLGIPAGADQTVPVNVIPAGAAPCNAAGLNAATEISAGAWHSLALLSNGEVCGWGDDGYGELGDEAYANTGVPTLVCAPYYAGVAPCPPLTGVTAISAGGYFSLAIVSSLVVGGNTLTNAVVSWGAALDGELGTGTGLANTNVPQLVCATVTIAGAAAGANCPNGSANAAVYLTGATLISAGEYNALADLNGAAGPVVAWGDNTYCELSIGNYCTYDPNTGTGVSGPYTHNCDPSPSASPTNCSVDPVDVLTSAALNPPLTGVTAISAGNEQDEALLSNKTVMTWGDNSTGQLGNGTTGLLSPDTCFNNGVPFAAGGCGWYAASVVKHGPSCPGAGGFLTGVTAISAGSDDDLALIKGPDGLVCAWGGDGSGELGDGANVASDVPVPVKGVGGSSLLKANAISAGLGSNNLAIKASKGKVVAWGHGAEGELGNDTLTASSNLPVGVCAVAALGLCPPAHLVTGVTMISAGGHHDLAFP